jgi:hypothetical protein
MVTLEVLPRPTPAERNDERVEIEIDEALTTFISTIEDWSTPRPGWTFTLQEGHDFGRPNNVEAYLLYAEGEQTSSVRFRLDQLDAADDLQDELVLRFDERDGIAKTVRCTWNGLDVEMFHILTFT